MDRFVTIYDWMLELGLTGMETSAFAVIYSFGKDGDWYQGSASDLGKWMLTKRKHTVLDALAKLVDKGFVEKREKWENGKKLCDYRPVRSMVRKTHRTGADSAPHIYRDIDSDNNKEIKKERTVQLSLDEFKRRHR